MSRLLQVLDSFWQRFRSSALPQMPLNEADQILLRFSNTLAKGVPNDREVHCESELSDSKEKIKLSLRVVLASLIELQMRTGVGQADVIEETLCAACHLFDFAPPDVAQKIQAHAQEDINLEFTSFITNAASLGIALQGELRNIVNAILELDVHSASFRAQVDSLVGVQTSSPLQAGGGSIFRNNRHP